MKDVYFWRNTPARWRDNSLSGGVCTERQKCLPLADEVLPWPMKEVEDFHPRKPLMKTTYRPDPRFSTAQQITARDTVSTFHKQISPTWLYELKMFNQWQVCLPGRRSCIAMSNSFRPCVSLFNESVRYYSIRQAKGRSIMFLKAHILSDKLYGFFYRRFRGLRL